MLIWIHAAELEVVAYAPRAASRTVGIEPVPNQHKQTLSSAYMQLLDITHNMGIGGVTPGRPITRQTMERMQAAKPTWRSDRGREVRHFMVDERDSRTYHLWPAPLVALTVEASVVVLPVPLASLASTLTVGDEWKVAVLENVISRAHSQQSDSANNTSHMAMHYAAFANLVGLKLDRSRRIGPGSNSPTNPAHPAVEKNGA